MEKIFMSDVKSEKTGKTAKIYFLPDDREYITIPDTDLTMGEQLDLLTCSAKITAKYQGIPLDKQLKASYMRK